MKKKIGLLVYVINLMEEKIREITVMAEKTAWKKLPYSLHPP